MSRFLRALQKAGLVELEGSKTPAQDDTEQVLEEIRRQAREQAPAAPTPEASADPLHDALSAGPAVVPPGEPVSSAAIARPLDVLYAEAGVPASPFPAEKMLKVLDGLKALDPPARKAAVLALDAADDSWSIDDTLLDAQRKMRTLDEAKQHLARTSEAAQAQAKALIDSTDQAQQATVARIRQQISDLEALLEREITRAAQEKAEAEQIARGVHDACVAEAGRLDAEVLRLSELGRIFASPPPAQAG